MASLVRFSLIILFLSGGYSIAAPAPIKNLQSKLERYQKNVKSIRKEMRSLDSSIRKKNKRLVDVLQRKTSIQNTIIEMEHSYQKDFQEYSEIKDEIKKRLKSIALNQMGEQANPKSFFKSVLLKKKFQKQLRTIKAEEGKLAALREQILVYQTKIETMEQFETNLNLKLIALESRQDHYLKNYNQRIGQTSNLSKKIRKELLKRDSLFSAPVSEFEKRTHKKKGVYYTLKGRKEVVASKAGKIIYVGTMSNYGNVVMIQHANNKISIYLGQFAPRVKQEHSLDKGDVLGYTDFVEGKSGSIYFEVRHNNVPQNTIKLIDKV